MEIKIHHSLRKSGFTVIDNYYIRDPRLCLKTKGLLTLMLSLPADWNFSIKGLAGIVREGESLVRASLQELEKYGYLTRTMHYSGGRITAWTYEIYENPDDVYQGVENQYVEKQGVEKQGVEKQDVENRRQINKEVINKEELNKEETSKEQSNTECKNVIHKYINLDDYMPKQAQPKYSLPLSASEMCILDDYYISQITEAFKPIDVDAELKKIAANLIMKDYPCQSLAQLNRYVYNWMVNLSKDNDVQYDDNIAALQLDMLANK